MNKFLVASFVLIAAWSGASAQFPTCQCTPANTTGEAGCCTYTRGWWRNHNKYKTQPSLNIPWPAPCADGPLDQGEDSPIFPGYNALMILEKKGSGGDKCFGLGAQFVAASMNQCNGACVDSDVQGSLDDAWALLTRPGLCPGGLKPSSANQTARVEAILLEDILEGYNSGEEFGPGHCDSESPDDCPVFDCEGGCTRTRGYWQTHSKYGNGKKDAWDQIDGCPHSEDNILYPGVTWHDVLSTPAGGDACKISGAQYVAAKLNIDCNDACIPPLFVADALACVEDKLANHCPELAPPLTDAEKLVREELLGCGRTLDAYNNGFLLGPGNCDNLEQEDNGGNGNGNGGGPKKVETVSEDLTTEDQDGISIATLVLAAVGVLGIIIIIWAITRYTNFKMGRYYQRTNDSEI